jgi:alpha-L-fucosidase
MRIMKWTPLLMILALAAAQACPAGDAVSYANYKVPTNDTIFRESIPYIEENVDPDYHHASMAAVEAFRDMKYGVRIHWGLYSVWGKGNTSWPFLDISYAEKQAYQEIYKTWNPTNFNAGEWMKLFKDNGLKMFAFTANHHEGFTMFGTKAHIKKRVNWTAPGGPALEDCDFAYSIMDTPFHRDVVKELCDAGHKYGLKIDFYYSHPNWYNADYRPFCFHPLTCPDVEVHPDLYGTTSHTNKSRGLTPVVMAPDPTPEEEARMLSYHRQQLTELLTQYGKIDMICLDMWMGKKVWPQMRQEIKDLRKLQPDVMFRARAIGNYGDYYTPEDLVPGENSNQEMPWFVVHPYGQWYSYIPNDHFKGSGWILTNLTDVVAKGGNFMVGIGADANGSFAPEAIQGLKDIGAWLKVNGEAIYATRPRPGKLWKEGGAIRYTRAKDHKTIYAITRAWPGQTLNLKTVKPQTGSRIYMLGCHEPLSWNYAPASGLDISIPSQLQDESKRPCKMAWSFKITPDPTQSTAE